MLKKGVYGCLALFIIWVFLLLLQIWWQIFSVGFFVKLTFTLVGFFFALLAVVIVVEQYNSEKKMKDDDFLE